MKYKVIFGREAIEDLQNIFDYLMPHIGAAAALTYVDKIRIHCIGFSNFPQRGALRSDIRPGLRVVGYRRKATIAFALQNDVVMILRIFHHGRNIAFSDEQDDLA